jgi:Rrf2 family protein
MHISVKGKYALEALFDLSVHSNGHPIKIGEIARRQQIPQKFLELILAGLKQGGFVESKRGAEGGYLLARAAEDITVGQVLRFVEAKGTVKARPRGAADSPFSELWSRVDRAVSDVVDQTTFGDLRRAWNERQSNFVPNWEI